VKGGKGGVKGGKGGVKGGSGEGRVEEWALDILVGIFTFFGHIHILWAGHIYILWAGHIHILRAFFYILMYIKLPMDVNGPKLALNDPRFARAISGPQKVSIFRAHPFQWPK